MSISVVAQHRHIVVQKKMGRFLLQLLGGKDGPDLTEVQHRRRRGENRCLNRGPAGQGDSGLHGSVPTPHFHTWRVPQGNATGHQFRSQRVTH